MTPDALLIEVGKTYGPLVALGVWLFLNRQKATPPDDVSKEVRTALRRIETAITRIETILKERNK